MPTPSPDPAPMAALPPIRVLHPTSAWVGGHVLTCINILKGMQAHGADVRLHLNRTRIDMGAVPHRVSLPQPVARLGLARYEAALRRRTERRFLAALEPGAVAWLWPGASLEVHREVRRRGNPLVMEGINTRQAEARKVLDAAYAAEGLASAHRSTDRRMAEEEEMLACATHFFSPSPGVDAALTTPGSAFSGRMMKSSYGAWMAAAAAFPREPRAGGEPVVLFAGTVDVRKGAPLLLRAWAKAAPPARLVLAGRIEPAVARVCAAELALPSVTALGYVAGIYREFARADVFVMPSLEEGDPQVTYEAASFGLPILASPAGGGRLAERTDAVFPIDPRDTEAFAEALTAFATDPARRAEYGARAAAAAPAFDWDRIGVERIGELAAAL